MFRLNYNIDLSELQDSMFLSLVKSYNEVNDCEKKFKFKRK